MSSSEQVLKQVRAALNSEPALDFHRYPLKMHFEAGVLTLQGEVQSVAAKKLTLEHAAAVPAVAGIVDRVRVVPAERMGDGAVRDHVRDALLQEPALQECTIHTRVSGQDETVRESSTQPRGRIVLSVQDGVVTLDGDVPSLSHKRLAGVLAWWVPGSCDVVNGLGVEPPEEDNDDEVTDAVRLVLEKDPFVDASQVWVRTRNYVVTLEGLVPTEAESDMAERDAWYVFAVDQVVNHIEVRP